MAKKPVSYLQTDPRWKNVDYSAKGEKTTIGASGCGPTAMAMVLATLADSRVTPETECAWALAHGYKAKGQGTYYSYFPPAARRFGVTCDQMNGATIYGNATSSYHKTALTAIKAGDYIIACMGKGNWTSSGHFVLIYDINEKTDTVYINDPASTLPRRVAGSYALLKKQVKYYWRVRVPAAKKKEVEDLTKAETEALLEPVKKDVHALADAVTNFQRSVDELKEAVVDLRPKYYDTLEEIERDAGWAYPIIAALVEDGIIQGDQHGKLRLTESDIRQRVMSARERAKYFGTS